MSSEDDRVETFTTSDGATLAVRITGRGPTLVMLHGWAMGSAYFDPAIARLRKRYRIIAPDFRAHGASPPIRHGHRMARYARDVIELITAYDTGTPLFLLGWSMGASVIMAMFDQCPAIEPDAVIYVDQTPFNTNTRTWSLGAHGMTRAGIDAFEENLRSDFDSVLDGFVPAMFVNRPPPDTLARLRAISGSIEADSAADILVDHINQDWRDVIRRQSVPGLAIACDGYGVAAATQSLGTLSDAIEVVTFHECGHCPFIEQTDRFVETVDRFLAPFIARPQRRVPTLAFGQPLGALTLIAFAVEALRERAADWARLAKIGPWFVVDPFIADDLVYRGRKSEAEFAIALAASGSVCVSLIQPKDSKPSIYQEVLKRRGEGALSHIALSTRRFDEDVRAFEAAQCPPLLTGKAVGVDGQRFAYFDTMDVLGPIAELIEVDHGVEMLFRRLQAASENWDGRDPVRDIVDLPPAPAPRS